MSANPNSLQAQVLAAIERLGRCTLQQLQEQLGHLVTPEQARNNGLLHRRRVLAQRKDSQRPGNTKRRRGEYSEEELLHHGRRMAINTRVKNLQLMGYVRRVGPSTYEPVPVSERPLVRTHTSKSGVASRNRLTRRVLAYVQEHGRCSLRQIRAALGYTIDATIAARRGRSEHANRQRKDPRIKDLPLAKLIANGRRTSIMDAVAQLRRGGELTKLGGGYYQVPSSNDTRL